MSEYLLFAAIMALVCLPLSLALASAGLPLTSAVLLFDPPKRVKVFRDKYGQQTATCCLLAGIAGAVFLGGAALLTQIRFPAGSSFWLGWPLPLAPLAAGLALAAMLAILYRAAWQRLKDTRPVHAAIGIVATAAAWCLGYFFLTFFRHFAVSSTSPGEDPALFLPPINSAAWFLLPYTLALSLSLAGAASSLYLIHRRDKDDFGRDYYNYALKLASKWALVSMLFGLAVQAGLFALLWPLVRDLPIRAVFFWGQGLSCCSFLMACLLWGLVIRNQNPLRLKFHCVAAYFLCVAGLAGLTTACVKFFFG